MPSLTLVRSVAQFREASAPWRKSGESLALVPTMGALHEGHLSLIRLARTRCERVAASLFVNPAQFSPSEDFAAYPRDEARDAALLAGAGCDLVYVPPVEAIYPPGFATTVSVAGLTETMEGRLRPTHFAGVATVVAKLLIQTSPHLAVFGEKDFQQLQVIRRLVRDLDLSVQILGAPIARDADGLALSSRNAYLTAAEREIAPRLFQMLTDVSRSLKNGRTIESAEAEGAAALIAAGFAKVDYLETRQPDSLERLGPGPVKSEARLICAVRLGHTRLLDNMAVTAG